MAAYVENQDLGVPDLTPKSSLGIPSIPEQSFTNDLFFTINIYSDYNN